MIAEYVAESVASLRLAHPELFPGPDKTARAAILEAARWGPAASAEPSEPPFGGRDLVDNLILDLVAGDYRTAGTRHREDRSLSKDEKKIATKAITDHLLVHQRREWTNHGAKRTFRYWTREEKIASLTSARKVIDLLDRAGFRGCLGFGAVLGYVRTGDLIPHDDDIDVIVCAPRGDWTNLTALLDQFSVVLTEAGFKVAVSTISNRHVSNGPLRTDLFGGFVEDRTVSWYPGPRGALRLQDVFPTRTAELLGVEFPIPADPIRYLEVTYGPDWHTPLTRFQHFGRGKDYADQI